MDLLRGIVLREESMTSRFVRNDTATLWLVLALIALKLMG